ncbi:hypothetical protein LUZ61_006920 [Rhynchospora tenuis]|uniref:Protein transport protein Sec24-like At3g07100 n=1 Tax=Rhynchospora tenuis TaxID=198213 RepID=A0AAD5ZSJ5_9POAL|nr:hypothetical protein LUZ61_006920 [Rhynchospora tenuis]
MQPPTGGEKPPSTYHGRPLTYVSSIPQPTPQPAFASLPVPGPPFATSNAPGQISGPQFRPPFSSSQPVPGGTTAVPPPPPPQAPFAAGQPVPGSSPFAPVGPTSGAAATTSPPIRFNGPSLVGPTPAPTYQQPEVPRFSSPSKPVTPLQSSFIRGPPQPPIQSVPMAQPPTQIGSQLGMRSNMPPPMASASSLAQQHVQGFTNVNQQRSMYQPPPPPPPGQMQFPNVGTAVAPHGQMQFPHSGATMTAPPQVQFPSMGPQVGPPIGSTGAIHSLVEEFQSLSVGAAPGSIDSGVDVKTLPRPLQGDEEPTRVLESYPLNCHPRYFRLTTHALPNSQSLHARWHLPLGAVVHPLAESPNGEEVPVINFGNAGVIRCRRCRTYINPYVTFADSGRKWRCNLCQLLNDVPAEYFSALDASGRRYDADQRPELNKGTVDFLAPAEYMVRPPMPPCYFFLIDVSLASVQCGLLEVVAKTIKSCLDQLPGSPRTQIGFITFDSTLHFHNLKSSLTQPQMMVVPDLDDVFLPLPDDLLVNLSDSRNVVDSFLDSLPTMFQENPNVESATGPALKAAYMVMSQIGGKLLLFQSNLPSIGIGRLRLRGDDVRAYGTDKEHILRVPEDPFYKQMAAEFTKNQISVDIFAFSNKYCDIASLGTLSKYTGGQVYFYPSFHASTHGEKLQYELARNLTRETAWEAVMRIRCGKGVRFSTYHGHFMLRSTDLLALPAVDCDKAFSMQLNLEDTLMTTQTVYFQVALLYTSSSGERRIRVHTAAAPVVPDLGEMYRQADTGAIISLLSRMAVETTLSSKLEDARQMLQLKLVKSFKEYRNLYAVQHRLSGRLIFPDSLKYLPLYILSLCKSWALRGGYADVSLDERCAAGYTMMVLPIASTLRLLYPALYRMDEVLTKPSEKENIDELLMQVPLTVQCLDSRGLYLLNNGLSFILWLGRMISPDLINVILGGNLANFPDLSKVQLNENGSEVSKKLTKVLKTLRQKNPSCHQLVHIIRQGEQPREGFLLLSNLAEDQSAGAASYVDWVLQIHRQTQG